MAERRAGLEAFEHVSYEGAGKSRERRWTAAGFSWMKLGRSVVDWYCWRKT